jgi:chromosome segregation ATPase
VTAHSAGTRWWRRGRDEALARARAAAATAANAFVSLDSLQRATTLQVEAYAALEPGPAGAALAAEWDAVHREADGAAAAYLLVPEQYDVDTDLTEKAARDAVGSFHRAEHGLRQVLASVNTFNERNRGRFTTVEQALGRLGVAGREADAAMTAAREAIARAEAAGTPAHDAVEALAEAERARAVLAEGAAAHGLRAAVAAADTVLAAAARARTLAETIDQQRDDVSRALTSARTRMDAVRTRRERLAETLSALRRSFVTSSYSDVEGAPAAADRELATAREQLAEAERQLVRRNLPTARAAVAAARQALDAAGGSVDAVTQRHDLLRELKRDPRAVVQRTRFVVREAQKLFVFLGDRADQRYATQLDSLVKRVSIAEEGFAAAHPDFWRLDRDLARIRDETADVVRRLRGI